MAQLQDNTYESDVRELIFDPNLGIFREVTLRGYQPRNSEKRVIENSNKRHDRPEKNSRCVEYK